MYIEFVVWKSLALFVEFKFKVQLNQNHNRIFFPQHDHSKLIPPSRVYVDMGYLYVYISLNKIVMCRYLIDKYFFPSTHMTVLRNLIPSAWCVVAFMLMSILIDNFKVLSFWVILSFNFNFD